MAISEHRARYGILWLINRQKFLHLVLFNDKKLAPLSKAQGFKEYDMLYCVVNINSKEVVIGGQNKDPIKVALIL